MRALHGGDNVQPFGIIAIIAILLGYMRFFERHDDTKLFNTRSYAVSLWLLYIVPAPWTGGD